MMNVNLSAGEDDRPLDHVLQLPDVARPFIGKQSGFRRVREPGDLLPEGGGEFAREKFGQRENRFPPVSKRRQSNREDVESVIKSRFRFQCG